MALLQEDRLSLSIDLEVPRWRDLSIVDRALALGVAAALVLGAGGLAYTMTTSPPGLAYTELYLLDSNGGITSYPSRLNVSPRRARSTACPRLIAAVMARAMSVSRSGSPAPR